MQNSRRVTVSESELTRLVMVAIAHRHGKQLDNIRDRVKRLAADSREIPEKLRPAKWFWNNLKWAFLDVKLEGLENGKL